MKKRLMAMLLAALMLLSVTACGSQPASTPAAPAETPATVGTPAPAEPPEEPEQPAEPETWVFTDDAGREVELDSTITRIVPSSSLAQIILLAIAPEMLVGLAGEFYDSARGLVPDYLFELPEFGHLYADSDLNIEALALTEPQLIIDIGEAKSSVKEDMDALQSQTLIPSVFINTTLETMPETFRTLGKILGKEEKAEELAAFCEDTWQRTQSIMAKVGDNKLDALYVLGDEGLNVIAATSYHSELIDMLTNNLAVVDNPLSKGSGNEVTMEQLALWDPEFVIFAPDSIYDSVKDMDPWNRITAIVNDNYIQTPDAPHNWMSMPPSVQRYLGLIWLPAVLYPEYCDYDVEAEIREYYELFYGCSLTDEQFDAVTAGAFLEE